MSLGVSSAAWRLPIAGGRVVLRPLRASDLEDFHAYRSDPEVGRYQGWATMSRQEAAGFISSMADVSGPVPGAWIQLAMAARDTDALMGDIGLYLDADGRVAQIGCTCAPAYQRTGVASEALRLVLQALGQDPACERVIGIVDARNVASKRLLARLGFRLQRTDDVDGPKGPCIEETHTLAV